MQTLQSNVKSQGIFNYILLMTAFFLLFEVSFFIVCNKAYLADFTYITGSLNIPVSILPGLLFFVAVQLAIHFFYALTVFGMAFFCGYLLDISDDLKFNFALAIWVVGIVAALSVNQYHFPNSKFSELSSYILFTDMMAGVAAYLFSTIFLMAMIIALAGVAVWLVRKSIRYSLISLSILAMICGMLFLYAMPHRLHAQKFSQPNVIIIGVDSLRPDFLGFFGADSKTPFLDNFLNAATVFNEAITPLARTFPSWSSILLGQYPRQSGIRSNLANVTQVNLTSSLPAIFKQNGYDTLYATDESRFSNIDESFGFDLSIAPPMGLNDFLIGTFNDFPLSNLLVNSSVGAWIFPYSYGNRPVYATYDPDSFLKRLQPVLFKKQQKPLFLAIHFCLPHHPYLWMNASPDLAPLAQYQASIQRVDQQIQSFFSLLNQAQLLDHTLVVVLSDHGEALELSGDRITEKGQYVGRLNQTGEPPHFYPLSMNKENVNQSVGHGTDVLGLTQYHTLLAFKLYGMGKQLEGEVPGIVPLSDLKQTVLTLAGISQQGTHSPLAAIVRGEKQTVPLQHIFIESDYSPASIRTVYPETRKVLLEGIQLFQIDPISTRLSVKKSMGEMIMRSKQFADIYGDWMLALYPQSLKDRTPILINLKTGQWTSDMHSTFALRSPVNAMLAKLRLFYGPELTSYAS